MMKIGIRGILATVVMAISLASCGGNPNGALAHQCSNGLDRAYERLSDAEAKGFGGGVDWTKAASLLAAAKVQYEFEHYPNCIEKVQRAQTYLARASGG